MKRIAVAATVLLLAGCGSPRTDFYTLTPVAPPHDASADAPGCAGPPLIVQRVLIPGILDRQSIVSSTGSGRLGISNQDRWAAPLDQIIQRVLAEDLRDRLPPGRVLAPGDPPPASGAIGLDVNILRFMPDDDGSVVLRADWTLLDTKGAPMLTRSERIAAASHGDAGSAVLAMSHDTGELADKIAAALAQSRIGKCRASGGPRAERQVAARRQRAHDGVEQHLGMPGADLRVGQVAAE